MDFRIDREKLKNVAKIYFMVEDTPEYKTLCFEYAGGSVEESWRSRELFGNPEGEKMARERGIERLADTLEFNFKTILKLEQGL